MDCEDEWGLIEKPSYDIITSNGYHRGHSPATNKRHSHSLRGYQYLISLMVNPAQFGFVCPNLPQRKKFKGLGALNQYFDMLVPNQGVSTIPDVWEGYYRITLAYFDTNIPPVQLEEVFNSFQSSFNDVRLHEGLFRSSKLDLSCANFPLGYKFSSEPIALYVSSPHDFLFESLLEEMKQLILPTRWIQTPADQLHMNIRLYSNDTKVDEKLKWTWHRVCETGLPKKVGQHPIEFYCSRLEIIPSRKTCQQTCSQRVSDQWWLGVTELDGKCSACQTPIKNGNWNGTCFSCEQYESIKPIWFIPYTATTTDSNEIERNDIKSTVSEAHNLVRSTDETKRNLWQTEHQVNDNLKVTLSGDDINNFQEPSFRLFLLFLLMVGLIIISIQWMCNSMCQRIRFLFVG